MLKCLVLSPLALLLSCVLPARNATTSVVRSAAGADATPGAKEEYVMVTTAVSMPMYVNHDQATFYDRVHQTNRLSAGDAQAGITNIPTSVNTGLLRMPVGPAVSHVSRPTLTIFLPPANKATGMGIIVCPDFMVLVYPVISFADDIGHAGSRMNLLGSSPTPAQVRYFSNELQVSPQTPPTFLLHAGDDTVVPVANSIRFYEALRASSVAAELHVYAKGNHGFINNWPRDNWLERCRTWFLSNGWL